MVKGSKSSDLGALGKEVKLGEKEDHEKNVTEALLVLEKNRLRRKLLDAVKGTELKQDVAEE